ncbi:MAG TPA: hypothetical protein VMV72_14870 [Verrucomicrobiae bacterium]|nr:hypothetical protein [Verrucomicrobiae bacterium]
MELSAKEKQMLSECETAMRSWGGWTWLLRGVGVASLLVAVVVLASLTKCTKPRVQCEVGTAVLLFLALGIYMLDAGANERRERKLSELVLKLNQGRAED